MVKNLRKSALTLEDNCRVAVVGGGPAGSFFSYFLLMFAERLGREISLDIFEPRDFSAMGPLGCNMCGGIVSESLVQSLAMEGINLPDSVVQRGIDSYVMHTEIGTRRIDTPTQEKRIAAVHRGGGPRTAREVKWDSFDGYLLEKALAKGAQKRRARVTGLGWKEGKPEVRFGDTPPQTYDLLVGAGGVNSPDLKLFENLGFQYRRPKIVKTYITELPLGADEVKSLFGSSMHVFLLNLPRLDFAALIPKGDNVTLCMLGTNIDKALIQSFLDHPEVKSCFRQGWSIPAEACRCSPKMAVGEAHNPFADRVVLIGDCGASRLYKDGIGAAFRTARAAARTAVFNGISAADFAAGYLPEYHKIGRDNIYGKLIFGVIHLTKPLSFATRAVVGAVIKESTKPGDQWRMSSILWDMFTGSSPYRDIFFRTLHPAFLLQYSAAVGKALFGLPALHADESKFTQLVQIK